MQATGTARRKLAVIAGALALLVGTGLGVAAATTSSTPSNAMGPGMGVNEYGMTRAYFRGVGLDFTYTKGFFCDTSVTSTATSGCEAGANFNKAPAANYDPLYITVPLGFNRSMIQCPTGLICVDHPGTIDLRRLEPALKPLYPQLTKKQLLAALHNAPVPEHDHFITTANNRKPEWWDVKVIGVTSPSVYNKIQQHRSYAYIQSLLKAGNKNVVGPIPTNLFLYFSVG